MPDPSPAQAASAAMAAAQHQARIELAAAAARTPGEWVDIYQSIIEFHVKTSLEMSGEGGQVLDKLAEPRASLKRVRAKLESHGLPLDEELQYEGPHLHSDEHGFDVGVTWPHGQWIKLIWPDESKVEFRGNDAFIAFTFIRWWAGFSKVAQEWAKIGSGNTAPTQRRMIEPGSPEWDRYFLAKAADQERMKRGGPRINGA